MKKTAIIVAAGNHTSEISETPGQFQLVNGKPLLFYTLRAFLESFSDLDVILVLPEAHMGLGQEVIDGYFDSSRIQICPGGETRFQSVRSGINRLSDEDTIVFVHDGVRCLVSPDLIRRCYNAALQYQTAVPIIIDMKELSMSGARDDATGHENQILAQTPQTFHSKILKAAFGIDYKSHFNDEASVVEAFGLNLHRVQGEERNFKVHTAEDVRMAEKILGAEDASSML